MILNFLKNFFSSIVRVFLLFTTIALVTIVMVSSQKDILEKRVTQVNDIKNINYILVAKNNNVKNDEKYFFDNLYLYTGSNFKVKKTTENGFKHILSDTMMELNDVVYTKNNYITKTQVIDGVYGSLQSDELAISLKTSNLYGLKTDDKLIVEINDKFDLEFKIKYIYDSTLGLFDNDINDEKGTLIFGENNILSQSISEKEYYFYSNKITNNLFADMYFIDSYNDILINDIVEITLKIIIMVSLLGFAIECLFLLIGDSKRIESLLENNFKTCFILTPLVISKIIIYGLANIVTLLLLIITMKSLNLVPIYAIVCLSTLIFYVLISIFINLTIIIGKRLI